MAVLVPIFSLIAFSFIPLGQLIGWYIENAGHGIMAYSVNVLASLAGILLYTLLCFLYQPPLTWFVVAGLLLVCVLWNWPWLRWAAGGAFVICLGLLTLGTGKQGKVYWSPYQKLTLAPRAAEGKIFEYELTTNDIFYQQILDLSPEFVAAHPSLFAAVPAQWNAYNLPYHFYSRPPSVLVLGSGMGNDVAAALRNGAGQVTAVEIDPLILKLGEKYHFEKPYSSPRVRQVQDDARSYVQNSRDRFDLIVFSLLDSHTTSSHYTNIRRDNYVYTLEALQASKRLLNADGVFVVKFQVDTPWIAGRLYGLRQTAFGHAPLQLEPDNSMVSYTTGGRWLHVAGGADRQQNGAAVWNHMAGKFGGYRWSALANCRGEPAGAVLSSNSRQHRLRWNFLDSVGKLLDSSGEVFLSIAMGEGIELHFGAVHASAFCRHCVHPKFR